MLRLLVPFKSSKSFHSITAGLHLLVWFMDADCNPNSSFMMLSIVGTSWCPVFSRSDFKFKFTITNSVIQPVILFYRICITKSPYLHLWFLSHDHEQLVIMKILKKVKPESVYFKRIRFELKGQWLNLVNWRCTLKFKIGEKIIWPKIWQGQISWMVFNGIREWYTVNGTQWILFSE